MPGYHGQAQVVVDRRETEPCQADVCGGAQTIDRTVQGTAMELRDDEPHSTQCLRGPILTGAGTEPHQPQVVVNDGAQNNAVQLHTTDSEDDKPSSGCAILGQDEEEAGTGPCQAGGDLVEDKPSSRDDRYPGTGDGKELMTRGR